MGSAATCRRLGTGGGRLAERGYITPEGEGRYRGPRDLIQRLEASEIERAGREFATLAASPCLAVGSIGRSGERGGLVYERR